MIASLPAALLLLLAVATQAPAQQTRPPLPGWPTTTPHQAGLDPAKLDAARDYALNGGGSGMVLYKGNLVYSWGDPKTKYDLKSTTKSFGATMLGLAIADGKVKLSDSAARCIPGFGAEPTTNSNTGWLDRITLFHLASQTAGFAKKGGFEPLLFAPGTEWAYSDGGPNWLADCLTLTYQRDLQDVMFDRVFTPLGITRDDLHWRDNAYRPKTLNGIPRREFGSGIHANVDAMARFGFLFVRAGRIRGRIVLQSDYVAMLRQPLPQLQGLRVHVPDHYGNASAHYGLLWWNNGDGTIAGIPRDAYWTWGLYDSLIVVIPSLDMVIARAGKTMHPEAGEGYPRIAPFLENIVAAIDPKHTYQKPPYPPSPVIAGIEFAPPETIVRKGSDCDNFPATWGADDLLYTAHGDCRGFEPLRPHKLGLGFARVTGGPTDFTPTNIPSPGDNTGIGAAGKKASGMLMVDNVLYLFTRNAKNSQLAWSTDNAKTWTWADWRFTTSFGHPAFLNYGRNYAGARDQYVYLYSPDHDSAYEQASGLVLARVPKDRIRDRNAYEFFIALKDGKPTWTRDITKRGQVFSNPPAGVYRTQVSYNPALKRYFLNSILTGSDWVRFQGGFGIYDAPDPWGPWTTAYFTPMWDVGPGENQHFPPKWMSADGKIMYLLFSGDDRFSVRKATVTLR
jgi:CubicO group peptidase (beta-lactamase class C family)